jgi:hypothetical protein
MLVINARLVHPVQQAVPVWMAHQAVRASRANQAKIMLQAKIVEPAARNQYRLHLVKDHQAPRVRPVLLDRKARPAQLVAQEKVADKAPLDHRDPLVQPEEMENQDRKAHLATMLPEEKARKVPKDHPVQSAHLDRKDPTVHQPPVPLEMVNPAHLVHPVPEVQTAVPANKVHKVPLAIPAQMPNIVLAHHEAAWSIVVALSLFFATSTKKSTI